MNYVIFEGRVTDPAGGCDAQVTMISGESSRLSPPKNGGVTVLPPNSCIIPYIYSMVLGDFYLHNWVILDQGSFVGIHIPAPWCLHMVFSIEMSPDSVGQSTTNYHPLNDMFIHNKVVRNSPG